MAELRILDLTDRTGRIQSPEWLPRAEPVHRQLRPHLPSDYAGKMARVFEGGGRLTVAVQDEEVVGVAVWRVAENTSVGRYLYVDDLVTDDRHRSHGVGKSLLSHCEAIARELDCIKLELDSGVQRGQAHRFYFREGFTIGSFKFGKALG